MHILTKIILYIAFFKETLFEQPIMNSMNIWFCILFALSISVTEVLGQDIVINEIMANPKNSSLPAVEYIELVNNGSSVTDLGGTSIHINNKILSLPSYLLAPQQFVILCAAEEESSLERYGNVIPISGWATLNNTGATIQLFRAENLIDEVSYRDNWHQTPSKKVGGWSLERINPNWCNMASNWSSSVAHRGGTPGAPNSIYNGSFVPKVEILSAKIVGKRILVTFNIDHSAFSVLSKEQLGFTDQNLSPTDVFWNESQDTLIVSFDQLLERNTTYTLKIEDIKACGVPIVISPVLIFSQGDIQYNDIVINEVLFNPKAGGSDFVEIYNRASFPIDLSGWRLGNRTISNGTLLLAPGEFLVLTATKKQLLNTHPNALSARIHEMAGIPAYPNRQGIVTLSSPLNTVDSLYYNAAMHGPWITDPKGISLERQSYDVDTNHPENFKSASTLEGGSTPGYQNSSTVDNFLIKNNIFLTSKTVSPDGDNFEDELEINYDFDRSNYMINLNIYHEKGILIKRLIRNQSAGLGGKVVWDCLDERHQKVSPGHYIYWAEIYAETGYRETFRGAFVVVQKTSSY